MSKYLEMPWNIEDTIENLKELKHVLKERCIIQNLHGRGEKDAEEVAFDFDRAIKALEEVQQYRAIGTVEECRAAVEQLEDRNTLSRPVGLPKSYEIITLDNAIEIVKGGGVDA